MNNIHRYKDTRNTMSGFDNSTKFSPYLSAGNISARMTYHSQSSCWIYFDFRNDKKSLDKFFKF